MGKYQPFNDLPAAQFTALVSDIAKRGVLLPILVDENGKTIDGHQRRKAAAEAGVECPRVVVEGLSEDEKQTLAITLNLFRRHLVGVERSAALQKLANLGMSTRHMGSLLGLSKSTVHRELEGVDRPEVTDSLGRTQPASKTPKDVSHLGHVSEPPEGIDPETGEVRAENEPDADPQPQSEASTPPPPVKVETKTERNAREAEERRVDRNIYFGKHLIGLWALLGDGNKPVQMLLDGWVPDECPAWLVDAHKPVFTADGIRSVATLLEKLATEWESRV